MITLTPKPPTAEERLAMLRLAKAARDSMVEDDSKLPRQDDVQPFYLLVAPDGDSFVWKMDPRSESEQQQFVAQVRRVVANSRPDWVIKVWPGQMAVPPGAAARDVLIVHIEGQRGVLAVGTSRSTGIPSPPTRYWGRCTCRSLTPTSSR